MTRNLKALGLALVAVFAMSAVASSAAQAAPFFSAGEYPAHLTGEADPTAPTQRFNLTGLGNVKCPEVHATSTLNGMSGELTAENVEFKGPNEANQCKALNTFPVTVDTNGCDFKFTVENTETATTSNGKVHLICPSGGTESITITIFPAGTTTAQHATTTPVCTIHVTGGQTFSGITYHNTATSGHKEEVTVEAEIVNQIHANYEGSLCGTGTDMEADYEGKLTVSAKNGEGAPIDTTIMDTP